MDLKSAIDLLSIHNDWRRDDTGELPQVQSKILGEAIDFVVSEFKNLHLQNVSGHFNSDNNEENKKILTAILYKHTNEKEMKIREVDYKEVVKDIMEYF